MKYIIQFFLFSSALVMLSVLQYQFWYGENGYHDSIELDKTIELYEQDINNQTEINRILAADVVDLKTGLEAIEEHARLDLGFIKPNETFVQISTVDKNSYQNSPKPVVESSISIEREVIPDPLNMEQINKIDAE